MLRAYVFDAPAFTMHRTKRLQAVLAGIGALLASGTIATASERSVTETIVRSTFTDSGVDDHEADEKLSAPAPTSERTSIGTVAAGGTVNQTCTGATIIPGDAAHYNPPPFSTTQVLTSLCAPLESCDGSSGTFRSVYYRYTPDLDGTIEVNTFGSNYNTVISIFDACASSCGLLCCNQPNELACNDDALFGTQSQVFLSVQAGETYYIKAAALGFDANGGTLNFNFFWYPANNLCRNAQPITGTAFQPPIFPIDNAQQDLCEAQESCEFNNIGTSNSVFYSYTPPCNGTISVNTNGSTYDVVLSIWDGCGEFIDPDAPCDAPNELACDDDSGTGLDAQLVDVPVVAGEEYIIKVTDYTPEVGSGFLQFNFFFDGADPPVAEITSPSALSCICDFVHIEGSAYDTDGSFNGYVVEYQPANGGNWTLIGASNDEVIDGFLAFWNTSKVPLGNYNIKVTVEDACGNVSVDTRLVTVDKSFGNLDVRIPEDGGAYGGVVCIDGTIWDQCFDSYEIGYSSAFEPTIQPVDPNMEKYTTPVINDPLASWNTAKIQDGSYSLHFLATDECEHTEEDVLEIKIDNTPPRSEIAEPISCSCVEGEVEIFGTAADEHFDRWVLQYAGDGDGWTTIAQGTEPVEEDLLATWNTEELSPCSYALRLITYSKTLINCDDFAHTEFVTTVEVGCDDVNFDTDGDGDVDMIDYDAFQNAFTGAQ
ncbi:MAG: hypothetical protein ACPGXK_10200 [Phycisphaerae bacterium]